MNTLFSESFKKCYSYQSIDRPITILNSRRNSKDSSIFNERVRLKTNSRIISSGLIRSQQQQKSSTIIEDDEKRDYVPYKNKDIHKHNHSDRKLPHIHTKGCG